MHVRLPGHLRNTQPGAIGAYQDGSWHAFYWRDEQEGRLDLGALPDNDGSWASDANDDGTIVGTAAKNGSTRAWRTDASGALLDLNDLVEKRAG